MSIGTTLHRDLGLPRRAGSTWSLPGMCRVLAGAIDHWLASAVAGIVV